MVPVLRREGGNFSDSLSSFSFLPTPMMSLGKFIQTADARKTSKARGGKYDLVGGHVGSEDKF